MLHYFYRVKMLTMRHIQKSCQLSGLLMKRQLKTAGVPVAVACKSTTAAIIDRELKYGAHNYHPLPVAIEKAKGQHSLKSPF